MRFAAAALLCFALSGCGPDPETLCEEIFETCHEVDDGADAEISECHETSEEADLDFCKDQHEHCLEICEAAAG